MPSMKLEFYKGTKVSGNNISTPLELILQSLIKTKSLQARFASVLDSCPHPLGLCVRLTLHYYIIVMIVKTSSIEKDNTHACLRMQSGLFLYLCSQA